MSYAKARQAAEVYTKGTKAWFPNDTEAWVSATCISNTITDDDKVRIVFKADGNGGDAAGHEQEFVIESTLKDIDKDNGATLPPLRNPPRMEYTDDLTNLSHLNEPSVLNTIRARYIQHLIYTYSGIVLIAVNPFDRVALYDADIVQQYAGRRRGELEPHLFAIAEDAYRCMIREQMNQTIVVSGESGAGKTVSAKYIMRYFATADDQESSSKRKKPTGGMTKVEEQILATNPIMEAFGNAKTTRNDNSSRFGKYIEIQFDKGANIVGARIRTYLLERSRLIFQPQTERNYHIFYQLCAGAPASEKKEFDLQEYSHFNYLNQSGTGTIPGVDDVEEFQVTQRALSTIGLSVQLQWQIFRLLAALLHIGNINITGRGDAMMSDSDPALLTATRLLGIPAGDFRKWILRKQIVTRSEKIVTNLNPTQAHVVKDSVAKYVYANMFEWLVAVTNESLSASNTDDICNFIGVLDIYGFEHFQKNSFEQFCINYANEKLQQQFNQHVFKLEQEEYVREKINWTFIEFSDNQKCIELIEGKLGVLSLLDEESRLPAGTDQGFIQKLYSHFGTPAYKDYFKKPRFSNSAFTIAHYAHDVEYESENFLDKNKDTVPDEHLALLQSSEFELLREILEKSSANNPTPAPDKANKRMSMIARKPTLGSIFKLSLIQLMETIGNTNVHYIRCIKPNEAKTAWGFEPNMVLAQLRACGVLETIRISCAGYPSRWTFEEFADRYYALVPSKHWGGPDNIRDLCSLILDSAVKDESQYQIGTTKIFFRAGQLAYLEKLRADRFNACATLLQKNIRRHFYRTRYLRMRQLALALQCVARRKMAQAHLKKLLEERAAIIIQTCWRRYTVRQQFLAQLKFILQFQTAVRGHLARRYLGSAKKNHAAIQIQRLVRGWLTRKQLNTRRSVVVHLQACIRRRQAQKQLMLLRAEARSANHFKEVSYKLENKIVELTQTLTSVREENKTLQDRANQMEAQIRYWTEKYEKLEKKANQQAMQLETATVPRDTWEALQTERDTLAKDYQSVLEKVKCQERDITQLSDSLAGQIKENEKLALALQEAQARASKETDEAEVAELRSQNTALKAQLTQAMRAPRRADNASRGLSPAAGMRRLSPSPTKPDLGAVERQRSRSPINPALHPKTRRNSVGAPSTRNKSVFAAVQQAELLGKQPRPTSIDQYGMLLSQGSLSESIMAAPEEKIQSILRNEETLLAEVTQGLIRTLKMPLPNQNNPPSRKEVLFPAHLIGLTALAMWRSGFIQASEHLLFTVMDSIQKQCLGFTGEEAIIPCAFWLSNTHELLSLVCLAEDELAAELDGNYAEWQELEKLFATIKFELQCLEDNIFHAWMKELKRRLQKMVVPAVIESQSLPGFITADSGRFLNKLLTGSSHPAYNMDDLLLFFNKVHRAMFCYFLEQTVVTQVITEMLKMVGVNGFNDLLMRKNFSSWKRAMQIQYNITRIEEWCKGHDVPEGTLQLEHLMQTTKLLQFKKASVDDIENIYDICWILSPTQIQKLISNYQVADYESPIAPEILKAVASHVVSGDVGDILLLDSVSIEDTSSPYEVPAPRQVQPQPYLPAWINLKNIRTLTVLFQAQHQTTGHVAA